MRHFLPFVVIILLSGLITCKVQDEQLSPDLLHFDATGDTMALDLAAQVLETNGGQQAWSESRYVAWTFFGRRRLVWDKWGQQVRIHYTDGSMDMSLHIPDTTGMVWKNGVVMSEPDSLDKYLNQAYRIWINDSYWLLMPFKLRDPGVHLSYIGRDTTQNGTSADVLEMEFTAVGVTPQNKYHIWIGGEPKEVLQWAYYRNAQDSLPGFTNLWTNYQPYEPTGIVLSSGRGPGREMGDIKVYKELPEQTFTEVTATNW
ncbi:MAG: hypothetical protein H6561_05430 [Lewinellaceae bacterium]|nr:hypothetical protein [Lewinellaceae bacterium]HQU53902.1 hypothetical protein [Saprospiraceae bacterium]